ncbi:MAG: metalloregulator ArsR/SmtB family transcription factor [Actinomycetota bacterium]|nr:metalloregulator ArsR/SmtB family transcription factor [Actinomycetota bacterium]
MLPKSLIDLAMTIPPGWIEEFPVGSPATSSDREQRYTIEYLARWAEVLEVEDYDTASAAMREITVDDAIGQVVETCGLEPATRLGPAERLSDLEVRLYGHLASQFGFHPPSDTRVLERERGEALAAIRVLRGEPFHSRFWHWMDRFFYEVYRPWRETRLDAIAALEQTAIAGLGSLDGTGPPDLGWLPPDNTLVAIPAVGAAAEAGEFEVVFWAEPFGLSSAFVWAPGMLAISFAPDGIDLEYSTTVRDDLISKLKALADPTRMGILRMIRLFDFDNTQIARYLNLSRPTVSVHAKILSEAGLITTTREGRQARHAFHPDAVRRLCDDLLRYLDVAAENPDE